MPTWLKQHLCSAGAVTLLLLGWIPAAFAAAQWSGCKPVETAVFPNRVHVKCETPVDRRFTFFAVPTTEPRFANRTLAILEGAELGDKYVFVRFDPDDLSGAQFGCETDNCRNLLGVALAERDPGRCEIDSTQSGCPAFCSVVANQDPSCPGYCESHDDMNCPGNCGRHPDNPECVPDSDPCQRNPHLPQCQKLPK